MLYKSIVKVKCFNQTKANENNNSNEEYKKRKQIIASKIYALSVIEVLRV